MGTSGPSKNHKFSKNLQIEKNIEINTLSTKKEDSSKINTSLTKKEGDSKINTSSTNKEDNCQTTKIKESIEKLLAILNKEKCQKLVSSFP